jgi:hypothetical protein
MKKTSDRKNAKLQLTKQTIRMTPQELARVAGGYTAQCYGTGLGSLHQASAIC